MSQRKFAYLWTPKLAQRNAGPLCPEVPKRCEILAPRVVFGEGSSIEATDFESRTEGILSGVHDEEYIAFVRTAPERRIRALDSGDTRVTKDVFEQALLSASAGCHAVDLVMGGEADTAFCAVRPPGHHANRIRALGFCIFNNAAVAADYARKTFELSRVLILDWDVHPGNGTQEIFWEDPSVFVLSFHEEGQFAKSGSVEHVGDGEGRGFNRNIELEPGTSVERYIETFTSVTEEVCASFKPELIIISAGFDAHVLDPAASQNLEEEHYGELTRIVLAQADRYCSGRCVSILEGGYNVPMLRNCVEMHCRGLQAFRASFALNSSDDSSAT
jgi:acetoin utilization deacetylase AcuC-like enzyme